MQQLQGQVRKRISYNSQEDLTRYDQSAWYYITLLNFGSLWVWNSISFGIMGVQFKGLRRCPSTRRAYECRIWSIWGVWESKLLRFPQSFAARQREESNSSKFNILDAFARISFPILKFIFLLHGKIFPCNKKARGTSPCSKRIIFKAGKVIVAKATKMLDLLALLEDWVTHPPFKRWVGQQLFSSPLCCTGTPSRAAKNWCSKLGNKF